MPDSKKICQGCKQGKLPTTCNERQVDINKTMPGFSFKDVDGLISLTVRHAFPDELDKFYPDTMYTILKDHARGL